MPKSSNHLALARQWEMLKNLPARAPGVTSREICALLGESGYEVSKRTVERDLTDLSLQFGIVCNDTSKPYGWHWLPGRHLEFDSIEIGDAVSLALAEDVLKQMLPSSMLQGFRPRFEQARRKLSAVSKLPVARLKEKLRYVPTTLNFQPPSINSDLFEVIQEALIKDYQIEGLYAPFQVKAKKLRLNPLGLVQRGNTAYLLATGIDFDDVRHYAIHRFESVIVLDQKVKVLPGFSLDAHIAAGGLEFGRGVEVRLKAWLSNELATYLAEAPISLDQKLSYKKERWQLVATVHDSWQLQFWIMSQGAGIQVLEPKVLREKIKECLSSAVQGYQ